MNADERKALSALRFDVAPVPDDVWRGSPFHVDTLHDEVMQRIVQGVADAAQSPDGSPIGIALQGRAGSGKTHLLGWVREHTQAAGGYFFLLGLLDGGAFWKSTALAMLDGLQRRHVDTGSQLTVFLNRLCTLAAVDEATADAVTGRAKLSRENLDDLVGALRRFNGPVGLACHNTARALVLLAAGSPGAQDVGYTYLQSMEEMEVGERHDWGLHRESKTPQLVVQEISQLLALTGPAVIAVDQIDTLIAQSVLSTSRRETGAESVEQIQLVNQIADGLMSLRQATRRTLTVLACLPSTWTLIRTRSTKSVADRFHTAVNLGLVPDARVAQAIIAKRFTFRFGQAGFEPRYPTWPIKPEAFADAVDFTPRMLIKRVADHVQSCLHDEEIRELTRLGDEVAVITDTGTIHLRPQPDGSLDRRFAELKRSADISGAVDPAREDSIVPALLLAGLSSWLEEIGDSGSQFKLDPPQGGKYPLHARLRRTLDEASEDEQHWSLRAVAHSNPIAALARIQAARTNSGHSKGITKRKLFLLRNTPWNSGPRNKEAIKDFADAGGTTLAISDDDLATFAALRQLLAEQDPGLRDWLVARRPAGRTALLRVVLGEVAAELSNTRPPEPGQTQEPVAAVAERPPGEPPTIMVGTGTDDALPLHIDLESLRKHTAIFAGSGSGKTVLIRRLIEECALQGVSTIVLDPNNDLARLGDAWPAEPPGWLAGDADRARDYLDNTDVVVWTPRREAGRPLSFQPLPDFRDVLADRDEFGAAIDSAVASLAPRAKVDASTAKAERGRAVLNEALASFARQGGEGIRSFIGMLSALPEGVSRLDDAEKIAFEMSQNLTAAMVNDPLFGGEGAPADPGLLLTPAAGKRARVSVISFIGLPSEGQRQSFVNQLQMALFAWIRKNPAGDRPLGGLLVMDEAQTLAPSGAMTACTQSTLALASQARKYGLGLVFATQAPKGLHNRISGNAATQFFGLLNAPTQIDAAREMARAKGSDVSDISRLGTGEFYASGEGFAFRKIRSPLCLSHHPKSPLTPEEVLERAHGGTPGMGR